MVRGRFTERLHPRSRVRGHEGEYVEKLDAPGWLDRLGLQVLDRITGGRPTPQQRREALAAARATQERGSTPARARGGAPAAPAAGGFATRLDRQAVVRRLPDLPDGNLHGLVSAVRPDARGESDDPGMLEAALDELDARTDPPSPPLTAAEEARDERLDGVVAGGAPLRVAYADAIANLGPEHLATGRRPGETKQVAMKRLYGEFVALQHVAAVDATGGRMLSPAGQAAGIDPVTLFSGPEARARKHASDELRAHWTERPRVTFAAFTAAVSGPPRAAVPRGSRAKMAAPAAGPPALREPAAEDVAAARGGLDARLATIGRRQPAERRSLDMAARALAAGATPANVARALRADAKDTASREDAETLRLLAGDLTRKVPVVPPYINDRGNIDLPKLAEQAGIDIRRWMPADEDPHGIKYHDEHPFDRRFRYVAEKLADPEPSFPRAKVVTHMRAMAAQIRDLRAKILKGDHPMAQNPHRAEEMRTWLAGSRDAARDLERLADAVDKAKVPPKKRAATLGGTQLGEVVPVDETRFTPTPLKGGLLRHRGAPVPESFTHSRAVSLSTVAGAQPRPGLTDAENRALDLYTNVNVADKLNGSLRRGRNVHGDVVVAGVGRVDLDQVRRDVDEALAGSELSRDAVLWRGTLVNLADLRRLVPGALYTDLGYVSTSTDGGLPGRVHRRRASESGLGSKKPVTFKILAPKGTHAALGHEDVSEVVLPRGQQFRVVRVDDSGPVPVVVMEVLPQAETPGIARGRHLVDEFDYEALAAEQKQRQAGRTSVLYGTVGQDRWLASILREQGFDGRPAVGTARDLDEALAEGGVEMYRGVSTHYAGGDAAALAEQFRSGDLYPGTGRFGNGTYATPHRSSALGYAGGDEAGLLRMVLRRDARTISLPDLLKLRAKVGITKAARELNARQEAEVAQLDPTDAQGLEAVTAKYDVLRARHAPKSRVAADLGRMAALLGYDAIVVPVSYRGQAGGGVSGVDEYVILNRTALLVQEAQR